MAVTKTIGLRICGLVVCYQALAEVYLEGCLGAALFVRQVPCCLMRRAGRDFRNSAVQFTYTAKLFVDCCYEMAYIL